jgi:hypothetical protein
MRGIETGDDSEMAYRRGYEHGVIELFYAIKRFLDPTTQEGVRAWIEKDVDAWRTRTMLGYPPVWRLRMLDDPTRHDPS